MYVSLHAGCWLLVACLVVGVLHAGCWLLAACLVHMLAAGCLLGCWPACMCLAVGALHAGCWLLVACLVQACLVLPAGCWLPYMLLALADAVVARSARCVKHALDTCWLGGMCETC